MVERVGGDDTLRWGTWEELILGGAVLRHGSQDWDAVASELQARTLYPFLFTPQVCKAKYEVLQERYSSCSAWIEELRKKRVNELRRELEKSEESIGSLESRLETLKSEKAVCSYADHDCSAAESSEPLFNSRGNGSAVKEASRDGSSAGSFTQTNGLPQCQTAATEEASAEDCELKPVVLEPSSMRLEKFPSIDELAETMRLEHGVNIRRRRGKRRRKDLNKEGSVGENKLMCSPDTVTTTSQAKEKGTSGCIHPARSPDANHQNPCSSSKQLNSPDAVDLNPCLSKQVNSPDAVDLNPCSSKQGMDDFIKVFDSIAQNEHASVFRRRLDSQKRARYKRIIRRHMDLDTIRSRIANKCITSTLELLRDLLLLANNALVFYSKSTREYKCALMLRDLVTKIIHQHYYKGTLTDNKVSAAETPKSPPMRKPPAKPRSARPFNCKFYNKAQQQGNNAKPSSSVALKACNNHAAEGNGSPSSAESSAALTKKTQGKRGKVGRVRRGNAGIQAETPMKVRKRVRIK